jgi:hypothetical protein
MLFTELVSDSGQTLLVCQSNITAILDVGTSLHQHTDEEKKKL